MHEVLVNRLGGLSLPRKSVVRLTDRPDMTLDVYRGRKTTIQHLSNVWLQLIEILLNDLKHIELVPFFHVCKLFSRVSVVWWNIRIAGSDDECWSDLELTLESLTDVI